MQVQDSYGRLGSAKKYIGVETDMYVDCPDGVYNMAIESWKSDSRRVEKFRGSTLHLAGVMSGRGFCGLGFVRRSKWGDFDHLSIFFNKKEG